MVHSSVAFDLTVTSLFVPLVSGRTMHLDAAWRNVFDLSGELTRRTGLDLLKLTPSHLSVINHALDPGDTSQVTHSLVLGGENLSWEHIAPWRRAAAPPRIFNEYGPTETAVGCTVHEITAAEPEVGDLPIGRPVDGSEVYVLDGRLAPVPVGRSARSTATRWSPSTGRGVGKRRGAGKRRGVRRRRGVRKQRSLPSKGTPWKHRSRPSSRSCSSSPPSVRTTSSSTSAATRSWRCG
jgi:non-ribosomal peptide synthetase component F